MRKDAISFRVAFPHEAKGILVETHPEMQAVFFNSPGDPAPGSAFAAQPPSHLVNSDLVLPVVLGTGELECRRKSGTPSSDHGNAYRLLRSTHAGTPLAVHEAGRGRSSG